MILPEALNYHNIVLKGLSASDAVVIGNLAQLRSGMVIPRR